MRSSCSMCNNNINRESNDLALKGKEKENSPSLMENNDLAVSEKKHPERKWWDHDSTKCNCGSYGYPFVDSKSCEVKK